ncbi:MAG TPA: hypothetical protein VFN89_01415 [Solirubrobacterales bacterium]|nr:hypothetical protein [Solirubrobacterales bacterium]
MIRNLKVLGLALAAVFALSAAIAASASAETPGVLTVEGATSATLNGVESGSGENFFETAGTKVECAGSTFTGTKVGSTTEPVPAGASEVTITPHYTSPCVGAAGVDMEGCDYKLSDATTTGGVAGTYGVTVNIICPGTKKIKVTSSPCAFLIGSQTVTGFHLTNESSEKIRLSGTATGISGTACGFPISAEQHQNVLISGTSGVNPVGVTLSHN